MSLRTETGKLDSKGICAYLNRPGELEERNLVQRTNREIRIIDSQRFLRLLEHLEEGVRASLQLVLTWAGWAEL